MGISIAFWVLGILTIVGALAVVTARSLFRAALGLILCFLCIAGLFVTLSAEYLGMAQILLYIGAIAVLIIMATMLTHEVERSNLASPYKLPAIVCALLFLGVTIWVIMSTSWPIENAEPTTTNLGELLFGSGGLVLAVEIAALLIVAAIIGAISVAKEK